MHYLIHQIKKLILASTALSVLTIGSSAFAEPHQVSSPDLQKIKVKTNRAPGRLIIYTNYATHRVLLDDAEIPSYLGDIGVEVSSNELHKVRVVAADKEKSYQISVDPGETMALYVDLGSNKKVKADEKKKEDAYKGFLTVTAESDAQVYIDGKLVSSKSPLKKHEIATGTHAVRVYFLDTKSFSKSRDVYVGRDASMSVHFTKDKDSKK